MTLDLTFASHYIKEHTQGVDLFVDSNRALPAPLPSVHIPASNKRTRAGRGPVGVPASRFLQLQRLPSNGLPPAIVKEQSPGRGRAVQLSPYR